MAYIHTAVAHSRTGENERDECCHIEERMRSSLSIRDMFVLYPPRCLEIVI